VTDVALRERLLSAAFRIRMVEERVIALYPSDRIQRPVSLGSGQEALGAGTYRTLRSSDLLFTMYRTADRLS
jgi:pyruvate dehydrogenase E1 component alpha subunit